MNFWISGVAQLLQPSKAHLPQQCTSFLEASKHSLRIPFQSRGYFKVTNSAFGARKDLLGGRWRHRLQLLSLDVPCLADDKATGELHYGQH